MITKTKAAFYISPRISINISLSISYAEITYPKSRSIITIVVAAGKVTKERIIWLSKREREKGMGLLRLLTLGCYDYRYTKLYYEKNKQINKYIA